ncbi:MAG TPA: alternative ribosome rescue aminoacyl-tRNA hydrolase ArfB [Acidimicrobiales bacterium]|nr:alternative ribosome rescue aminoacyl-tRNA hydrolase ArfB [Acidimicrobiales bacterium]
MASAPTGDGPDPDVADTDAGVLRVTRSLSIPLHEVEWRASTPGGPGGQHANRTQSRVEVSFDVRASGSLGPRQRARVLERYGPVVRAAASESRSQARNRQLALERLATKLAEGLRVAAVRRATTPTRSSQVRRVESKRHRSEVKRRRRPPGEDD